MIYSIRRNDFKVLAGAGNCCAITMGSDSSTHVVHKVSLKDNYYSSVNTNNREAVFIDSILNVEMDDVSISGFTIQYRIQRTDLPGVIMASRGRQNASSCLIKTKNFNVAGTGVFARLQTTNL